MTAAAIDTGPAGQSDGRVSGGCLCGAVRFTATLPSQWVAHCHCTYCRRAHGAAFVTWAGFAAEAFAIDPGGAAPAWYASSPGARRAHCARCGTPMFFESTRWPGEVHVARALIEGELDRAPQAHVFYDTHVPWLDVNDGLPTKPAVTGATTQAAATGAPTKPAVTGRGG